MAATVERERGPPHSVEIDSGTGPSPVAVIHVIAADHHSPPLRPRVVRREKSVLRNDTVRRVRREE